MFDVYEAKPKTVKAKQWDGSRAEMHLLVGMILTMGHEASIEDGYSSQGPDLISIQTKDGYVKVYPKDYVVKDGAYLTVKKPGDFEAEYQPSDQEPKEPYRG